jgi:hypothetical protein
VENAPQTFGSSRKKQDGECWQFTQWLCGNFQITAITEQCAKGICPKCHCRGSRSRVVAKFAESGGPVFTSMDVLLNRLYSFETAVFEQKKGYATFSSGL